MSIFIRYTIRFCCLKSNKDCWENLHVKNTQKPLKSQMNIVILEMFSQIFEL